MFGWFFNNKTGALTRYFGDVILSYIIYDEEGGHYALFSSQDNCFNSIEFIEASTISEGFLKLILIAEINLKLYYDLKNKDGSFYLDKESLKEDVDGYFRMD